MRLPSTGLENRMRRFLFTLLIVSAWGALTGQVHHSCPLHDHGLHGYQNPLYEKWLSAYDVKGYDLYLSVSNTDTRINGSAAIFVEAVRALDTLVLELQDVLTVSQVYLGTGTLTFEQLFCRDHIGHRY